MPKSARGFTLIELLVVIAIIAILSIIGLVAYGNFLKNSRDSKRQADLKIIQSALEDYHADQLYYPPQLTPGSALEVGAKKYLTQVPNDPKPPPYENYSYIASSCTGSQCKSYCLFANIEGTAPSSDSDCPPSGNYDYGVTRP